MTTKDLYDALLRKEDLHSYPQLFDSILVWHLYENAYVQAFCQGGDTSIEIFGNSLLSGSLMHWHPDEEEMLDALYALGKKGNLLVLKKSLLGTSVFYLGPAEDLPSAARTPLHFGKKKWDGGVFRYLVQK